MSKFTNYIDLIHELKGILVIVLLSIVGFFVWDYFFKPTQVTDTQQLINYIDSLTKKQDMLYSKIDSLYSVRREEYRVYEKLNIKYDTVQITIDTMPDVEGTKLLLSISRQLTSKGIE